MKVFRVIFVLVLLGWYVSGPYRAVNQIETAVDRKDADTLAKLIDAEDFKKSMKELALEASVKAAKAATGNRLSEDQIRSKIEEALEKGPMAEMLDEQLKPERFAQMMIAANKASGKKGGDVSKTWVNPVKLAVAEGSPGKAIFKLKGLSWKLSGIEATPEEMAKLMPGFSM